MKQPEQTAQSLAVELLQRYENIHSDVTVAALTIALGVLLAQTAENPFGTLEAIRGDIYAGLVKHAERDAAVKFVRANGGNGIVIDADPNAPYPEAEAEGTDEAQGSQSAVDA
jgi:hypothetical protein